MMDVRTIWFSLPYDDYRIDNTSTIFCFYAKSSSFMELTMIRYICDQYFSIFLRFFLLYDENRRKQ